MSKFFDVLEPKNAISNLATNGVLVRSTSRYTLFEYSGPPSDMSGIACRIDQSLFPDMPLTISVSTTYLLKHFFKWKN